MSIHESSINFRNLIRDLAEMYPSDVSEVVVSELVANSLDGGARRIEIGFDNQGGTLIVADDGEGMTQSQFEEYHDFAAGLKTRGTGIGFAGLGAKVSFNIAERVITETRGQSFSRGSNWYLQSPKKLVWEEVKVNTLRGHGTRVEVHFGHKVDVACRTSEDLAAILHRHYLPLTDPTFLALYERLGYYSQSLRFNVNGEELKPMDLVSAFQLEKTRTFFPRRIGKKYGYGVLGQLPREPRIIQASPRRFDDRSGITAASGLQDGRSGLSYRPWLQRFHPPAPSPGASPPR